MEPVEAVFFPTVSAPRSAKRHVAGAVHRAFGQKIPFDWKPIGRWEKKHAILTFPTVDLAIRFLHFYRNGVPLRNAEGREYKAPVKPNNRAPNPKLVEGLQRRMEEWKADQDSDPDTAGEGWTTERPEYIVPGGGSYFRGHVPCRSVSWGVWTSKGEFGKCGDIKSGTPSLIYGPETGELFVVNLDEGPLKTGVTIHNSIIDEIQLQIDGNTTRVFLTLNKRPQFWSQDCCRHTLMGVPGSTATSNENISYQDNLNMGSLLRAMLELKLFNQENPIYRIPALSCQHSSIVTYCTVYVLELKGTNVYRSLKNLFKSMRRNISPRISTSITIVPFDLQKQIEELEDLCADYDYPIAFQLISFFVNGQLLPSELVSVKDQICSILDSESPKGPSQTLQQLHSVLPLRTLESVPKLDLKKVLLPEPSTLDSEKRLLRITPRINPSLIRIHRLYVTPSGLKLEGPTLMGSNRVLRMFPNHHDYFLKVTFCDENQSRLFQSRDLSTSPVIDRWRSILNSGIGLGKRQFSFLGFSSSSLKEHSVWFVAPFELENKVMTAAKIRSQLGDFSHIFCPPRYAARLGQTFTTTHHSIPLKSDEVSTIAEVSRGGYEFSDGVGTMSQGMLDQIWKSTNVDPDSVKSVVYQIRVGGSKGVLSLDSTLPGKQICLRPSMTKFGADNAELEIASRAKPLPLFLHRQLVVLLETLGVPDDNFMRILTGELARLSEVPSNPNLALQLAAQYGLGQVSGLPTIFKHLEDQYDMQDIFEIPFFHELRSLALSHALGQIKYRTRIVLEDSWKLMGVMDEFDYLEEREIYVCVKDERDGTVTHLKGKTLVTRSPTLHCGDIQFVYAVGTIPSDHPLASLYNCIVFSSKGSRPIANMLSGGDLDGDLFDVSQNSLLFPPTTESPASYPSATPQNLSRPCEIRDIVDFFLHFIVNDMLGQICHRHALLADQSIMGAMSPDCVKCAELASTAVDYPKTGISVQIQDIPKVDTRIKPDFMAPQPVKEQDLIIAEHQNDGNAPPRSPNTRSDRTLYYKSHKVLGEMYRYVDILELLKDWSADSGWNKTGPQEVWKTIQHDLSQLTPSYRQTWETEVKEAKLLFDEYLKDLEEIQWLYHPVGGEDKLSEAEVFMQCVQMDPTAKFVRGQLRGNYMQGLQDSYRELVESVRYTISEKAGGRFRRAAACFYVGLFERSGKTGESFAWIVLPVVSEAWETVVENGFVDEDE